MPADHSSALTLFDFAVMGILALSALVGAWRGIVNELVSLLSWVLALFVSYRWSHLLAPLLSGAIDDEGWQRIAGFALLFVAVMLLVGMVHFLVRKLIRALGLRPADRLFGFAFGVVRGAAIVAALYIGGSLIGLANEPWWRGSLFAPQIQRGIDTHLIPLLPDNVRQLLPLPGPQHPPQSP